MKEILLIEDHIELAELILAFLKKEGFCSYHVTSAEAGLDWCRDHHVQAILLDIMLPGMDGFAFCQRMRSISNVPILIISAKSEKEDQLLGFALGADDYIQKPVDPDILCAKLHALMYRQSQIHQDTNVMHSGALRLDVNAHRAWLHEEALELNVKEFALLLLFVKNPGKTLHKDYLFQEIWGNECESENQTLTVHIKMLRAKIEEQPKKPQRILTVWGVGYRYEEV